MQERFAGTASPPGSLPAPESLRFERKFFTQVVDRSFVESVVHCHPALFSPLFARRWVNNIYFDSWSLDSYTDNHSGESRQRAKVRIRWYGESWGPIEQPVLELKIKHNVVNRKVTYPLPPFVMDRGDGGEIGSSLWEGNIPAEIDQRLRGLRPTLVNRYSRNYFRSSDTHFRITVDSDLAFLAMNNGQLGFDRTWWFLDCIILELKYATAVAAMAPALTQHFPFRVTRSSKYVLGMDITRGILEIREGLHTSKAR